MKRTLSILLPAALLLTGHPAAFASHFYFSATDGDDTRTSVQAQSVATPWKTIAKFRSVVATSAIATNDTIFFKCGDTFADSLGGVTKTLTFTSYGSGTPPKISGFYPVTTWTAVSGKPGVYVSEVIPTLNPTVNMVAINGQPYAMGRYPNATDALKGYLTYESGATTTISDTVSRPAAINSQYNGAWVVLRFKHYAIEHSVITGISSTGVITFSPRVSGTPAAGYGYYIENSLLTLDQFGEWYFDPAAKQLYVYFGSNAPSAYTVQVSTKNTLLEPRTNLTLRNISFEGANQYAIYNGWANITGPTISNCSILYSGEAGISFSGHKNVVIDSCTVRYANTIGINMPFHNDRPRITHTLVRDIATFGGMMTVDNNLSNRQGHGICLLSQSWESSPYYGGYVAYNTVQNIGYIGIVTEGDSTVIVHNFVDTTNFVMDDGSGIYTDNQQGEVTVRGVRIDSNVTLHALGATEGTNSTTKLGEGIYLDDDVNGVEVIGNTCAFNSDNGIYIHNARKNTVLYNTLYSNGRFQLSLQKDHAITNAFSVDSNIIAHNTLFAATASQRIMYMAKESDITAEYYTFCSRLDSNQYCAPFARNSGGVEDNVIETNWFTRVGNNYNIASWRAYAAPALYDVHTTITPSVVSDPNTIIFKYTTANPLNIRTCLRCLKPDGTTLLSGTALGTFSSVILLRQ